MSVFDQISAYGRATAVFNDDGKSFSYKDLTDKSDLIHRKIGPRKLVAVITSNCFASIAGYVGCLRGGAVPLLLPQNTEKADLEQIVKAYNPDFIYAPLDAGERFELGATVVQLENYGLFAISAASSPPLHEDLALLLTTSGSTGGKSMVRLSAKNISSNAAQITEFLGTTADDVAITTMPMSYSYGLSVINTHLLNGATIVATDEPLMSRNFWNLMRDKSVTNLTGVPFIYEMLKKLRFPKMDLPALRYMTQAGGKLSPGLVMYFIDACQRLNAQFFVMYGQTEATARMTYMPPSELESRPESIGIPIPNSEIWLKNTASPNATRPNDTCDSGELVFKGPNVSLGTAENRADLAKGDENGGVLHTGDLVTRDKDGFLYVTGRKKRFLKLYGNRINLAEIETLLSSPGTTIACAGSDDDLRIFLEADPNENVSETIASIKQRLGSKTTILSRAYTIVPVAKLPRNDNGKISYHLLNTQFEAG